MTHIIMAAVSWTAVFFIIGKRLSGLWKAGLLGIGLVVLVDWIGTAQNLYQYPGGFFYIGKLPLFHILNSYALVLLYLNWLPAGWKKKALYTLYASAVLLAVEVAGFRFGAIIYTGWQIWHSYFLLVAGLLLVAFLSDVFGLL
ncbi:MAG: hypothetical protein ACOY4I_10385 [Bacillota bacterium]